MSDPATTNPAMSTPDIYLDNAATTPVRRESLEAMWPYLSGDFGNPSSQHERGRIAAVGLANARAKVAAILGCRPGEVVFTSGGTEADNLGIKGLALATPRGRHLLGTAIEHEAVLASLDYLERIHGFERGTVATDATGLVTTTALTESIRPDTTLVAVQYANNEVGTVQPIAELSALAHENGALLHCDAVQAAGWLPLNVAELGVDSLAISGHKVGAPKGIGALFVRGRLPLEPLIHGGGQERGKRSGTENVAGAVALATALTLAERERIEAATRVTAIRERFIAAVRAAVPNSTLTGHPLLRLPGTASFVFPGTSGEAVLLELERRGVVCSSGSACAAGSAEASHVLTALGLSVELAQTAVRFTFSPTTSETDADAAARRVAEAVASVASIGQR